MYKIEFPHIKDGNEVYLDCLQAILGDDERNSMIDLGCNLAPHTPKFGFNERKYIDIIERELDHKSEQQFFEQGDVLDTPLDKHYDVAFSLDCIEHLTYDNGIKLLDIMSKISQKQILFTPLDDIFGMDYETENPESHRSLWKPEMIEEKFPNKYIFIVFPRFHNGWNGGAFFFYSINKFDINNEFKRVSEKLNKYQWANRL